MPIRPDRRSHGISAVPGICRDRASGSASKIQRTLTVIERPTSLPAFLGHLKDAEIGDFDASEGGEMILVGRGVFVEGMLNPE